MVKNLPANAGEMSLTPGLGRSLEKGMATPRDTGAWQAAVHGVAKSWTQLSRDARTQVV